MNRLELVISAALMLGLAGTLHASEIYKWVDENGTVHYVDRPSGSPSEERLDVASRRTDHAAVRANVQARLDRQAERQEARSKAAEAAQTAAEAEAERKKRAEQCDMYRARLESYLQSRRLYREDESGERVYLDEEQTLEARAKVQEKIQETCD